MNKIMSSKCLVAVDIRSAHNVGAFFRTCDGFGAELVLIGATPRPKHISDDRLPHVAKKAHEAVAKTALGAENTVQWHYYKTLEDAVKELKRKSYKVFAIEQTAKSLPIKSLLLKQNTAIVVGREVDGLTKEEVDLCDGAFEIPMSGSKESFNVSIAAGIALYQINL